MESNNTIAYNVQRSSERMNAILNASNDEYVDNKNTVPLRTDLTYNNGFYVMVTSVFVDIVGSSNMADEHKRPVLAKMYRSFISETVAIMNSVSISKEINISGDCVWGIFETPIKKDIDSIITLLAIINSMIKILNYKLKKKGYSVISVGIGCDYGRALMIQAGYYGSGINDVVWMGDVVNRASKLSNIANRNSRKAIVISESIYININDSHKSLFSKFCQDNHTYYEGGIVNTSMENWYNEHCK